MADRIQQAREREAEEAIEQEERRKREEAQRIKEEAEKRRRLEEERREHERNQQILAGSDTKNTTKSPENKKNSKVTNRVNETKQVLSDAVEQAKIRGYAIKYVAYVDACNQCTALC